MRLLCVVWALALWCTCDGWVRRRHHRSLDSKHLRSLNPRAKERGRQVRAPRPTPRVSNPSTAKHAAGAQQQHTVLLHDLQTGRGQCLVNGMALYDGAAWAPDPCTMCMCDHGTRVCAVKDCAKVKCPLGTLRTPPGACCPVCTQPGATRPTSVATTERPRDKAVKEDKKLKWKPQKEKKILEAVLPAKGKGALSSSKRKKNAAERRQERILIQQEPLAGKDPTTKSKMGDTLTRPLVVRDAAVLPTQEAVSRGKTTGSPREVILAENESGDKKQPRPSTVPLEAASPTNVLRQEAKKGVAVKRLPVPTADKPQSNKTSKQGTLDKERHLGSRQEKDQLKASGSNSSSGPSSRVKGTPELEVETHMPSLPTNCLLAESTIACANTKMKYLPALSDPGLKTLYLAENEIAHLSADAFAGLPNLEWLDLSKNKLDDAGVHVDAFKNLTKLKRLNLDGNRLTAIPTLPPLLQELKMNDNGIQGLQNHSFRGLYKLLTLELEGNQFHDGNVYPLAFKPLRSLIYLRLDRNRFRAVPSGLPTSLQELHLDNNRIEQVSEGLLNKTLNLSVLVLSNNRLQEDRIATRAWIDLLKLESLDLSYNRLVHVPSFLPRGLRQLTLHHNQIERIPGYVFAHMKPGLEFLHLSHNHMRDDGIHATSFLGLYKSLAELLLDNNHLHSVPRGLLNLKALQVLRLNFNKIRYVPLNSICDTRVSVDSSLISVHLENNMIDRHLIPPTAFSCIKTYYSVVLRPQQDEDEDY